MSYSIPIQTFWSQKYKMSNNFTVHCQFFLHLGIKKNMQTHILHPHDLSVMVKMDYCLIAIAST